MHHDGGKEPCGIDHVASSRCQSCLCLPSSIGIPEGLESLGSARPGLDRAVLTWPEATNLWPEGYPRLNSVLSFPGPSGRKIINAEKTENNPFRLWQLCRSKIQ